jgi:hypothetical protein
VTGFGIGGFEPSNSAITVLAFLYRSKHFPSKTECGDLVSVLYLGQAAIKKATK